MWWSRMTELSRSAPGGNFALAAARVLIKHTKMDARAIAEEAMLTAASICVYTNEELNIEELS